MNAKQMLLDYAAKHNNGSVYTDDQFVGKMAAGGVCISREVGARTNAHLRREGQTLIVTETTISPTVEGEKEITVEVLRVCL